MTEENMSKLEELIEQYCPDGVEYVPLSSIGTIKRGNGLQKKDFVKAGIGCIHYGQIYTKFGLFTNKTLTYVDKELADHLLHIEKGDLVIACTSENVEDVCKAVAWLGDDSIVTGGHSCVLHHNQNPKYIAYFFQTESFQRQKRKYAYGTKVIDIKPDSIGKIEIPLPPLPVQEEIVRILDAFTELQAELQAELQKRKEQHKYYREGLLTSFVSTQNINKYKLGDICELGTGSHNTQDGLKEGAFPFYTRGVDILWLSTYDFDETAIITAGDGVGVGKVFHYVKGKYALHQRAYRIVPNQKIVLPRYLYYYFETEFYAYIMRSSVSSSVTSIRKPMLLDFPVILPSLSDQQKIVDILDRFDQLTNDLTAGLPAEIEKRRQQYEYYRDKLLTFKRKGA